MKVSKPVVIVGIIGILLAGYIHFFTGKKKTPTPVPAAPAKAAPAAPAAPAPAQAAPAGTPAKPGAAMPGIPAGAGQAAAPQRFDKEQLDKLGVAWTRDPFLLPKTKEEKRPGQSQAQEIIFKLVAIMEKGSERVAIIDHEVVRKGDTIGGETVQEIQKDKVILVRGGSKRVLNLVKMEDMVTQEEAPKTKGTERPK
ncbi:MAG TPA: hypothetical protein PLX02_09125 [Syntrophorhabdaceae bacterium]|nr:hypothetical protein [Syntrophorhabdaceae bacterium]HQM81768.1 hypothetical protein [Syntrophorhabdaceae bacterium]